MFDSIVRVLIVHDQLASVALLMRYLQDREIELLVAETGQDALRIAAKGRPDLILLDVLMSDIDGISVCRQLKVSRASAAIPVIFLSAAAGTEHKIQGFAAGGVDYITKPFSEKEVLARIFVQLGDHQRLQALISSDLRAVVQDDDLPLSASAERHERRIFSEAVAVLTKQLVDPPSTVDLAHRLGTNQQRLTRIFRQEVGMSPYGYMKLLRLERGRSLLHDTDLQVQLISDRVGYRNAGDFTRAFRRHFGMTPRQCRQRQLETEASGPEHLPGLAIACDAVVSNCCPEQAMGGARPS